MKKLSKEDSNAFLLGKLLIRIVPLLFFHFVSLSSQTMLNNFGISDLIKTHSGYTKFSLLDCNNDGIKDLFLFGNHEKSFVIHHGLKDSKFSELERKFFFFPIDDIKWLTKSAAGEDYFVFVSRNKRLVGLVSFTRSNSLQLLHTIEFNSYPSSLEITDFDNDGKNEVLVYGNNFNGIVKIKNEGYRLISEPLFEENVFSDLVLLDFNQDELDDIIGINVLNNTLNFLENNEISGFISNREIEVEQALYSLQKIDYNNDNFVDLAIAKEDGIEILQGDSVYSFEESQSFSSQFSPDMFIIADLNLDKRNDLVITNKVENKLVVYSNYETENYSIPYELDGITDLNIFKKGDRNILAALSRKGRIQLLTAKNKWNETFSFSIGSKLNKIDYIKSKEAVNSSFIIQDLDENSVSILNMDSVGNFTNLMKFSFLNNISDLSFSNDLHYLIGYSKQNRLLEIINYDKAELSNISQNYHYTTYPIEHLFVDNNKDFQVLELDGENLFHEVILESEGKYIADKLVFIDSLVIDSQIDSKNQIYYWTRRNNEFTFNRSLSGEKKQLISIVEKDSLDNKTIILNDKSPAKKIQATILKNDQYEKFYLVEGDNIKTYKSDVRLIIKDQLTDQNIQFYSSTFNKKVLFVYQPTKSRILLLEFNDNKNLLKLRNTIEAVNMNDYFVHKYFGKTYLVFTNKDNNCITYKIIM